MSMEKMRQTQRLQRPIPVSVIAWVEIVGGIVAQLVFAAALFANPRHIGAMVQSRVPFGVQTAFSEIGIFIMVASGIGILQGVS